MPWIATLQTRCARFPVAGLGPRRHSVPGTRDLRPAPRDERAQQPHRAVIGPLPCLPLRSERGRPDGRDHIQTLSATFSHVWIHFQTRGGPHSVHVGVHDLCRSTPDGENHVGLCDRHVETMWPEGNTHQLGGVPTFHGAASPTCHRGEKPSWPSPDEPGGSRRPQAAPHSWLPVRLADPEG